jgi:hypothetical protein
MQDRELNDTHVALPGSLQEVGSAPHRSLLVKQTPKRPPQVVPLRPHVEEEDENREVAQRKGKAHGLYEDLCPQLLRKVPAPGLGPFIRVGPPP